MAEKRYRLRRINHKRTPRRSEDPLHVVHSEAELKLYLATRHCLCGGKLRTRRKYRSQLRERKGRSLNTKVVDTYVTVCRKCRDEVQIAFDVTVPVKNPAANLPFVLNPTPRASEVLDAGQWLNLAYGYFEEGLAAQMREDPQACRELCLTAAAALDEVLKFYPEGRSLPQPNAFFSDRTRNAFHLQPEIYRKEILRGLQEVYRAEAEKCAGQKSALDTLLSSVLE